MSYDVYKAAVLRALPPAEPDIVLEAPPTESFDLNTALTCPACGNMDALVQEVQDAEIAVCPQCECEFSPRIESVSRKVIRGISERRQRRMKLFMERLPLRPESPNLDPMDYALFRKIVDRLNYVEDPKVDTLLKDFHDKFVDERVNGFVTVDGGYHPPITREEAEARWVRNQAHFRQIMAQPDDEMRRRFSYTGNSINYDPNEVLPGDQEALPPVENEQV